MGYTWWQRGPNAAFHSADITMPRCAVMGGAVVAALTAWCDDKILELFAESDIAAKIDKRQTKQDLKQYLDSKAKLVFSLHEWFIHENEESGSSPFRKGDVDVFLQASPFPRSLLRRFGGLGLNSDLRNHVGSFCGDFVQDDLRRMACAVYPNELGDGDDDNGDDDACTFDHAVSKTALNSMLTVVHEADNQEK
jgi:hypothetical protein